KMATQKIAVSVREVYKTYDGRKFVLKGLNMTVEKGSIIWAYLKRLTEKEEKTVIITTHYMEEATLANKRDVPDLQRGIDMVKRSETWGVIEVHRNFSNFMYKLSNTKILDQDGEDELAIEHGSLKIHLDRSNAIMDEILFTHLYKSMEEAMKDIFEDCGWPSKLPQIPMKYYAHNPNDVWCHSHHRRKSLRSNGTECRRRCNTLRTAGIPFWSTAVYPYVSIAGSGRGHVRSAWLRIQKPNCRAEPAFPSRTTWHSDLLGCLMADSRLRLHFARSLDHSLVRRYHRTRQSDRKPVFPREKLNTTFDFTSYLLQALTDVLKQTETAVAQAKAELNGINELQSLPVQKPIAIKTPTTLCGRQRSISRGLLSKHHPSKTLQTTNGLRPIRRRQIFFHVI
ncbi:unnamed protein product, partial [Nesidiocoris tenuis]